MILRILTVFCLAIVVTISSRMCVDNVKGSCEAQDIFGWCFHNKSNGVFDCDGANFCASQGQLVGKVKSTGCFQRENDTLCCCNENDGCNIAFVHMEPKFAHTQKCFHSREGADGTTKHLKDCDDPWCITLFSYDAEGGLPSVEYGCHSRTLVKHSTFRRQHELFKNNTAWKANEFFAREARCEEIAGDAEIHNGTQSMCYDFEFVEGDRDKKGRICCCRGSSRCNDGFSMQSDAIDKERLEELREIRRAIENGTERVFGVWTATVALLIAQLVVQRK